MASTTGDLTDDRKCWLGETEDCIPAHISIWSEEKKNEHKEYVEEQMRGTEGVVQEGKEYILRHSKGATFMQIKPGKRFKSKGVTIDAMSLVGKQLECVYEVNKNSMKRKANDISELSEIDLSFVVKKNNSKLIDDGSSQSLTYTEIEKMRKEKSGKEMIDMLVSNSSTFSTKTEFSQEKYLKRKKKKYDNTLTIQQPTLTRVISHLHEKQGRKMLGIRPDTIAHILTSANICSGSRTMVLDGQKGIVTGAVAERMGGEGRLFSLVEGTNPPMQGCNRLQLSAKAKSVISPFPMYLTSHLIKSLKSTTSTAATTATDGEKPKTRADQLQFQLDQLKTKWQQCGGAVDSVIVLGRYDQNAVVKGVWPLLAPGGIMVVYSQSIQLLADIMDRLKQSELIAHPELCDIWYREYQVLPNRTHPMMNMSSTGGYVLSATKLAK